MGTESSQILRPNYWFRKRFADREKIKVVDEMENPKTKTELRRILGFLTFFREHIEGFAEIAKPLTDLTSKKVPAKIPWEQKHQMAFDQLKRLLCKATMEPLYIVDFTKPFNLFVDASGYATSAVLTQTDDNGKELPVAFSSTKLNATQSSWSTIERERRMQRFWP